MGQSLSLFYNEVTINNGAESYNTLKSNIKTNNPNPSNFMSAMD